MAALLSEKLGNVWIPDALTVSATRTGELDIVGVHSSGKLSRNYRSAGNGAVIVTMRRGVAEMHPGKVEEVQYEEHAVDLDAVSSLTTVEQFIPVDPRTADLGFAERIVAAGRGAGGPEGVALVAQLAEKLNASLGASRMAVDLGWVPPARQIGQTGRTVSPVLYVACGISGASQHLLGMRNSKHIISVKPDVQAPIHDVAHLSLHGELRRIIPAIIAALERRSSP